MATTKTIVSVDSKDIESTITRTNKKIKFKALRSDKVIERIAWVDEWAGCNFVKYNGSFWMLVPLCGDNVAFFEYKEKVEEKPAKGETKTIANCLDSEHIVTVTKQSRKVTFTSYASDDLVERVLWIGDDGMHYVQYNGSFWKLNYNLVVCELSEHPFIVSEFKEVAPKPTFEHAVYRIEYRDSSWKKQDATFEGDFHGMVREAERLAEGRPWAWEMLDSITEDIIGKSFEVMSTETAWDAYNWGSDLDESKPVYRYAYTADSELYEVYIGNDKGVYSEDGDWCCEILESGSMFAEGWGRTPEEAMLAAYAESRLYDALEEGNCEDAVNVCAYGAYKALRGRECRYSGKDDHEVMGKLTDLAKRLVMRECERGCGFDWEEF